MEDGNEANKVTDRLKSAEHKLLEAVKEEKNTRQKAEYYRYATLVHRRFNDIENEKIYLKRGYDTVRFYNSIYMMYSYIRQCDSVETCVKTKRVKFKYRSDNRRILLEYRTNLLNAGRFYLKKKDYSEAYRFLDQYLSSVDYPMLKSDFLSQSDTLFSRVAYWAVTAAYYSGKHEGVVRYADKALQYPQNKEYIQEYACKSYLALNDTANWVHKLKSGLVNFPDHTYFFTNLMDYLYAIQQYEQAMRFADYMIQYNPKKPLYWFAKALICMRQEDYHRCVDVSNNVLALDSEYVEAYFLKGISYCLLARRETEAMQRYPVKSIQYQNHRKKMLEYYAFAQEPMEMVRKMLPDDAVRWAAPLYQIYLNLNKGKEFEEVERVINNLKQNKQ